MESIEERIRHHEFRERNCNENEERVAGKILQIHTDYPEACFCQQCLDNIFCVALNALPSKYENATIHNLRKKNCCTDEEIEAAVRGAIKKVLAHPKDKYSEHFPDGKKTV